jgi:RTA1 like protein
MAAAIIMCVAFGIVFVIGLINLLVHRKQIKGRFLHIFIFCPFAKMIGYALRSASSKNPTDFNLFISSQFFLFLTPQICAAVSYLTYAGLVFFVDEKFSLIGCRNVAIIFLGLDLFSTTIQGAGKSP